MDVNNLQSLYEDYLPASTGLTTGTGLSSALNGAISHYLITCFLVHSDLNFRSLWSRVKPMVEEICSSDDPIVPAIDDTVKAKPHTKSNELICRHYDHKEGRAVKRVQFLTALLNTKGISLPIASEFMLKERVVTDPKTGKENRKSRKNKNEMFRDMLEVCDRDVYFDYMTADIWFASVKNMKYVRELSREFIMAIKSNRQAALSPEDKEKHFYLSLFAYAKMEWLKARHESNHFALKTKIYLTEVKKAIKEVEELSTTDQEKV